MPEVNLDHRSKPKFDYCETNLNRFSETIKWLEHENIPEYSECNFNKFTDYIKQDINEHFLVDENASKKSIRTILQPHVQKDCRSLDNLGGSFGFSEEIFGAKEEI